MLRSLSPLTRGDAPPWPRAGLFALALGAATLAAFWPVFNKAFINFDTDVYILNNPPVLAGLTREGLIWAFTALHEATWQPLAWLSHMLDVALFGLEPAGHQAMNLGLHYSVSLLFFGALWRMTGEFWASALAAALFCLHPQRVESVAWIAERKGLLSALFGALCLHAYIGYAKKPNLARYALVALCLALALMAKPALMMLPALLLVLDFWPLRRLASSPASSTPQETGSSRRLFPARSWTWLLAEKGPLLLLSAASGLATYYAQRQGGALGQETPLALRMQNCLVSYADYLLDFFWPTKLAVLYPYPSAIPLWRWAGAALLLAGISAALLWARRRAPFLLAGWLWLLIGLSPTIGLFAFGNHARADRFSYFPSLGLCFGLAWAGLVLARWRPALRLPLLGLGLAALLVLALATQRQTEYWRDTETLFARAAQVTERNGLARAILGMGLTKRGAFEQALPHLFAALEAHPNNYKALASLGQALEGLDQLEQAAYCYMEVLRLKPNDLGALNNMGVVLARLGRLEDALIFFQQALDIAPDNEQAQGNLRKALDMLGQPPQDQPTPLQ